MEPNTKECTKCEQELPLPKFPKNGSQCKKCVKEYNAERYIKNKQKILERNKKWRDSHKEYRHAHDKEYRNRPEVKQHIIEYNESRKEVRKEYSKNYNIKTKDKKRDYDKEYREKNKDKIKARNEKNREKNKERARKYNQKNREIISAKRKKYKNKDNPNYVAHLEKTESFITRIFNGRKNNKKKSYKVTIDHKYLISLWKEQEGKCYITGLILTTTAYKGRVATNASLDQTNSGLGYIDNNVGFCCDFINLSKMQMPLNKFIKQLMEAGRNIKSQLYKYIFPVKDIDDDIKDYLITLFRNKKLVKKIGYDFIIDLYKKQGGRCAITSIKMTGIKNKTVKHRHATNISIDKINPKLEYTKDNIQLTCLWANTGKQQMTTKEYRNLLLKAYNSMMTPPTLEKQ